MIVAGKCGKTGVQAVFVQNFERFLKHVNGGNGCLPPALLPIAGFHVTSATKEYCITCFIPTNQDGLQCLCPLSLRGLIETQQLFFIQVQRG